MRLAGWRDRVLARARDLRWVRTTSGDSDEPTLDVEMARHYAHPANGGVHVLVPGRLVLVPPPAQLPPRHGPAAAGAPRRHGPPAGRVAGGGRGGDVWDNAFSYFCGMRPLVIFAACVLYAVVRMGRRVRRPWPVRE